MQRPYPLAVNDRVQFRDENGPVGFISKIIGHEAWVAEPDGKIHKRYLSRLHYLPDAAEIALHTRHGLWNED